uniref:Glucuronosyltransferase n=1 Tax=Parascaris equorum TaxID=6256 RepID=A0A914RG12_PAREQ
MPSHVRVLKWAPQFDILSHNKTVLFISHAGSLSKVRYFLNVHNEVQQLSTGFARSLNKLSLDGEKLLRVSLSEAVFWTNRSLRIGSRKPTFKRKGMFLSSTTYFYLPHLFGVLFAIVISYKL